MSEVETQGQTVRRKRIGELLIDAEIIRSDDLPHGLKEAENRALRLGEVLVMLRYLSAEDLESVLLAQTKLEEGAISDNLAVQALRIASTEKIGFAEALKKAGEGTDGAKLSDEAELVRLLTEAEAAEKAHGPQRRELIGTYIQLGDGYVATNRPAEAEQFYRKALAIIERSFGQRNLKAASCLSKIADLYSAARRYNEAEPIYWRVLDITQGAWGPEHRDVAMCHRSLARLFEAQGRMKEAEQFYLSSVRILEKTSGHAHAALTDGLRSLAAFWRKQGKKPERKRLGDLLVEAGMLDPHQLELALHHVQQTACPLGQALVRLNYLSEESLKPALQAQLLIGDGVLPLQLAVRALAATRDGKTFEDALEEFGWDPDSFTTQELKILIAAAEELMTAEVSLGSEHASVAVLSLKLADIYTDQRKYAEAEGLYKRAISILEKSNGPKDPELATGLHKYAILHLAQNKLLDAEKLLWRALEIRQQALGQDHLDIADCLEALAVLETKRPNPEQAERLYQSALAIREKSLGRTHEKTLQTLEDLAAIYLELEKLTEAETAYLRVIKAKQARERTLDSGLAAILERLAELYLTRKEYPKAETQLELAIEIREANPQDSDRLADVLEKYSFLLETTGRSEESWKMMERAQIVKRTRT